MRDTTCWIACRIVDVVSWLAPRRQRREWREEWFGELAALMSADRLGHWAVVSFVAGCVPDVLTVRRLAQESEAGGEAGVLDSPFGCMILLASAFALACGIRVAVQGVPPWEVTTLVRHAAVAGAVFVGARKAWLPLWAGEWNSECGGNAWDWRQSWWRVGFVILKAFLVLGAAGALTDTLLAPLSRGGGVQMHGYLIPYLFAARWCVVDERRRCPVCGWRTCRPVEVGTRAAVLLEWDGTERMCRHGHGLLYESAAHCVGPLRWWLPLDASWAALFRTRDGEGRG